jgi:hypothetical protein
VGTTAVETLPQQMNGVCGRASTTALVICSR